MYKYKESSAAPGILHLDIQTSSKTGKRKFEDIPYIIFRAVYNEITETHMHPQPEFMLIQSGKGIITVGFGEYKISTGDIVYISSDTPHSVTPDFSDGLRYISIIIDNNFMKECGICKNILFEEVFKDNEIGRLLANTFSEASERKDASELKIKANLINIATIMLRSHFIVHKSWHSGEIRNHFEIIQDIIDYIQSNYQTQISLGKLASLNRMSKCYMCRIFKEVTGDTILSYINTIRCIYAEYLLRTHGTKITDAAKICGFSNAAYFSRVFKKIKGYPPLNARRKAP